MFKYTRLNKNTVVYYYTPFFIAFGLIIAFTDWEILKETFREYSPDKLPRIIYYIVNAFLTAILFINGCKTFYYVGRNKAYDKTITTRYKVVVIDGGAGNGKSSTQAYMAKYIAGILWDTLTDLYYIYKSIEGHIFSSGDTELQLEYIEVVQSYEFFKKNEDIAIPCLAGNIVYKDKKGRKSYLIDRKHMTLDDKLPSYLIISYEEMGNDFRAEKNPKGQVEQDLIKLDEFCSFIRQYTNAMMVANDQASDGIAKPYRRLVTLNNYMLEQQAIMKPKVLEFIYRFILNRATKKMKFNFRRGMFLYNFQKLIDSIGFRRYYYFEIIGNDNKGITTSKKKKIIILPSLLNVEYSSRAFRGEYPPILKEISLNIGCSKIIENPNIFQLTEIYKNKIQNKYK